MNQSRLARLACFAIAALATIAHAQFTPQITFQGRLDDAGQPAEGDYDFVFRLFDAPAGGNLVAGPVNVNDVPVSDGIFTALVNFGPAAFNADQRWIQVSVQGQTLLPRQYVTPTPYALQTRGIKVNEDYEVGIGIDPNGQAQVDVQSSDQNAPAVLGRHAPQDNLGSLGTPTHGVSGFTTVNNAGGVYGKSTGVPGYGGLFEYDGISGAAVRGEAEGPTGFTYGLYGTAISDNGVGVAGVMQAGSAGIGVLGWSGGPDGRAGRFLGRVTITGHTSIGSESTQITTAELFGVHTDASTDEFGGMYVSGVGGGSKPFYGYAAGGNVDAYTYFHGNFDQWRLWCGADRIAINKQNGLVGIGTNSPAFLLHVNGSAGKPGGGSWSVASDERLKKNIHPLDGALESLMSLHPVTFEYIDPEAIGELDGLRMGLIAQEVEKVFPDWIDEGADGYKRMTVRGFEAVAIEAMRELRDEKDEQIRRLEVENQALRTRIDAIEDAVAAVLEAEKK